MMNLLGGLPPTTNNEAVGKIHNLVKVDGILSESFLMRCGISVLSCNVIFFMVSDSRTEGIGIDSCLSVQKSMQTF